MASALSNEVVAMGEKIKNAKNGIHDELSTAGVSMEGVTFSEYPAKVRELAQRGEPAADEGIISVTINKTGSTYELPNEADVLAQLLLNARIVVSAEGLSEPIVYHVNRILNATYAVRVPCTVAKACIVRLYLGTASKPYAASSIGVTVRPASITDCTTTTYLDLTEIVEVGRVQRDADTSGASFLIKRITKGGETHTYFGGWLPSGEWLDQSGLKAVVYDCPDEASDPVERVISTSGGDAVDITQTLACLKNMRQVQVTYQTATPINNYFMEYDQLWLKTVRETIAIPTFAEDGTIASTTDTLCLIKWFSDTQVDETYHLHPLFQRIERNADDGTYTTTDLPKGYIARYPIKFVSGKYNGVTYSLATSAPDGSREVAGTRDAFLGACKSINNVPVTIDGVDYLPNDERRFSMVSHHAEVSFLQHICYLLYGINIQDAIKGICTPSAGATTNGATDWLFAKGIMFGASDTTSSSASCLIAGIEDGLHSSTGWMTADLTFFAERYADSTIEYYMLFARDRNDFTPAVSDVEVMTANGYRKLPYQIGGTSRTGFEDILASRDLLLFSADTTLPNIRTAGVDNIGRGSAPSAVGRSAFMVALGNLRNTGAYLGLFSLYCSSGLGYSGGAFWRSRASLNLVQA